MRTRHDVLRFLEGSFAHAPRVRVACADTVVLVGARLYEVLTYLRGAVATSPRRSTSTTIRSAGGLLGHLHRALRAHRPPADARWPAVVGTAGLADAVASLEGFPDVDDARTALPLFLRFGSPPPGDGSTQQVVHNDFAWYNCTHSGRRIVVDFDAR
ncbi:MAG: phosphotransferase [Chloroflexota bacterium]|nr:phosphotransferase [Chloroflexota bacterium]